MDVVSCCFQNQDFQDYGDLQDWDDAGASFSPSAPVSGTGTGFDPLPSRERGYMVGVVLFTRTSAAPLDCGSSPQ